MVESNEIAPLYDIIPKLINHYQVIKEIGRGTFGLVVLAHDGISHQEYALKIVSRKALLDCGQFSNFEQELRIQQQIHHQNVLPILETQFLPEFIVVVTEFCQRGDLLSFILQNKPLSAFYVRRIIAQLCAGLHYLHSHNISHRDLKPENILLTNSLVVKIADFGCAEKDGMTPVPNFCGTLDYAPPEFFLKHQIDGKKADVWAFGVILFLLLTGSFPWLDCDMAKRAGQIMFALDPFRKSEYSGVLSECLDVDPEDRPSMASMMKVHWIDVELKAILADPVQRCPKPRQRLSKNIIISARKSFDPGHFPTPKITSVKSINSFHSGIYTTNSNGDFSLI